MAALKLAQKHGKEISTCFPRHHLRTVRFLADTLVGEDEPDRGAESKPFAWIVVVSSGDETFRLGPSGGEARAAGA